MELIRNFAGLGKGDAAIAGGKGASLGEMASAGIAVPPGFVVLSHAFERFIEETDLNIEIDSALHQVKRDEMHTVEHASAMIQKMILDARMPEDIAQEIKQHFAALGSPYVAVRSSATAEDSASAAWAGQLDSFLNTDEASLLRNVQRCWASLFTPRAIFYRFEKDLHRTKISVAVVVQKMVESEYSGIAFSVHPVTEDRNQLIIEAGFGLGEAIVSGQVTPDSYVVEKVPRRIIDINVSTQTRALYRAGGGGPSNPSGQGNEWQEIAEPKASSQVLTPAQILELSETIVQVENHYGFPCDIEWAFEGGKFYIVQSRPITTLSNPVEVDADKGVVRIIEKAGDPRGRAEDFFTEYQLTDKNLWTEQGRWLLPPFVASALCYHHMKSRFAQELLPNTSIKSFFYLDHYAFQLTEDKEKILALAEKFYTEGKLEDWYKQLDTLGQAVVNNLVTELGKDEAYRREHAIEILGLYLEVNDFWMIESYVGDLCIELAKKVGYVARDAELFEKVSPYLRDTWIEREVKDVVAMAERCITLFNKDEVDAHDLASDKALTEMAEKYLSQYSWSKYSWFVGEPITLTQLLERIAQEIKNIREGNHIETHKDAAIPDGLVGISVASAFWRAECGMAVMMAGEKLSFVFEEIATANTLTKDQALLLTHPEALEVWQRPDKRIANKEEVLAREKGYFMVAGNRGGLVVATASDPRYEVLLRRFVTAPVWEFGAVLRGVSASGGMVRGTAHVIQSASEFATFQEGEVLVSVETSPMFVPLMRKASAILTGKGGITSHAAIVSRELGKPCIIAIKDIVKILKTGDVVDVDADKGVVKIAERAHE